MQVRALSGEFPYYGELETLPASAGRSFRNGQAALVDQTMMLQYNAKVGDSVKLGNLSFVIAGTLSKCSRANRLVSICSAGCLYTSSIS